MRVVVIGGSGHVGTYLVPRLVREIAGAPYKVMVRAGGGPASSPPGGYDF